MLAESALEKFLAEAANAPPIVVLIGTPDPTIPYPPEIPNPARFYKRFPFLLLFTGLRGVFPLSLTALSHCHEPNVRLHR